jgi:transcriptional regulator with XRE-family HTH domain
MLPVPRLKALRHARFLSQAELAQAAGMSKLGIGRIEAGQPARLSTIRKLAAALGVTPGELAAVDEEGSAPPPTTRED